jgi:hypothetical protein
MYNENKGKKSTDYLARQPNFSEIITKYNGEVKG